MLEALEAFIVYFLSGLTFEFGDDLVCWARHELAGVQMSACRADAVRWTAHLGQAHPYAAFVGTVIGYAITPLSGVLSAVAGRPKSAGEAFGRGLMLELVEGALSVIGQYVTDPVLGPALWSLWLSAVIAPVRGGVAAFTFSWVESAAFRFLILLMVLGGVAIGLNALGLLPV